ncbi:branched-chain amino acid ABC transporter permease [Sporichthya polymorpha]|uniref:branched-chain amino acid ABC transporter permease n=1 Tax=Sporichthya polymorpha TaxID=35751 RepID=UPI00036355CA|nr:branched-chain amino acid ABC transporter permease [Sporichthya polymorpha]
MDWGRIFSNAIESGLGIDGVYFALAAIGLNIHFGYAGLLNFGQSAFMAMGAYGLAVSVASYGLNFWVGIAIGLGLSVVLAILLGIPTLRLRADYLAIVTIAAAEIIRLIVRSVSLEDKLGGTDGLQQYSAGFFDLNPYTDGKQYGLLGIEFSARDTWVLTVGWVLVVLCCLLVWTLMRSPWGRVLKAIREDEDAVRSLGKNVYAYKMQALVLGGVIGALGGFIAALGQGSVAPDLYGSETTFFLYTALILGGAARVFGPVVGAVIFWSLLSFTDNFLREAIANDHISESVMNPNQVGQVRFMLVGLGLVLMLCFRPQGIFGDRKEIALDAR